MTTPRERVKTSLAHQQPDRVPRDFAAVPEIWEKLKTHFQVQTHEEVLQKLKIDCRVVSYDSFCRPEEKQNKKVMKENIKIDIWGAHRENVTFSTGTYDELCYYPLSEMDSTDALKTYNWPRPSWWNFSSLQQILMEMDKTDEYHIRYRIGSIFETAWSLVGLEKFLTDLALQPELPCYIMDRILEVHMENLKTVLTICGNRIDMVYSYDDIATQQGLLFSPEMWCKYIKPHQEKLYSLAHKYNKDIMYHTCGAIRPLIEDFIGMGITLLNPIQPLAKDMNLVELKQTFGERISFHGGIDIQEFLPLSTTEKVQSEVHRICEIMGTNGGYILAGSHHFQADTPINNILAMYEVGRCTEKTPV